MWRAITQHAVFCWRRVASTWIWCVGRGWFNICSRRFCIWLDWFTLSVSRLNSPNVCRFSFCFQFGEGFDRVHGMTCLTCLFINEQNQLLEINNFIVNFVAVNNFSPPALYGERKLRSIRSSACTDRFLVVVDVVGKASTSYTSSEKCLDLLTRHNHLLWWFSASFRFF